MITLKKDFYSTKETLNIFNISRQTLQNWMNEGKIPHKKISTRKLIFYKQDIENILNTRTNEKRGRPRKAVNHSSTTKKKATYTPKKNAIYCRVSPSSSNPSLDIQKQVNEIYQFCNLNNYHIVLPENFKGDTMNTANNLPNSQTQDKQTDTQDKTETLVFTDISNGLSIHRPELSALLELISTGKINKLFVTNNDRLSRLEFEYIEKLCIKNNVEIISLNLIEDEETNEKELIHNLTNITNNFLTNIYNPEKRTLIKKFLSDLSQ